MPSVKLHCGNFKNGSTAIQAVLFSMRDRLAEAGVVVPEARNNATAHYRFSAEVRGTGQTFSESDWSALAKRLATEDPNTTVVMSSEAFMRAQLPLLQEKLAELTNSPTQFCFYVRPFVDQFASAFVQRIKAGRQFTGYRSSTRPMVGSSAIGFDTLIGNYSSAFGSQNIHVRNFNRRSFNGGSLIADFWTHMDLPSDLLPHAIEAEPHANVSPSHDETEILILLSSFIPAEPDKQRVTVRSQAVRAALAGYESIRSDVPSTKFVLPVEIQAEIIELVRQRQIDFANAYLGNDATENWHKFDIKPVPKNETIDATVLAEMLRQQAHNTEGLPKVSAGFLRRFAKLVEKSAMKGNGQLSLPTLRDAIARSQVAA